MIISGRFAMDSWIKRALPGVNAIVKQELRKEMKSTDVSCCVRSVFIDDQSFLRRYEFSWVSKCSNKIMSCSYLVVCQVSCFVTVWKQVYSLRTCSYKGFQSFSSNIQMIADDFAFMDAGPLTNFNSDGDGFSGSNSWRQRKVNDQSNAMSESSSAENCFETNDDFSFRVWLLHRKHGMKHRLKAAVTYQRTKRKTFFGTSAVDIVKIRFTDNLCSKWKGSDPR